MKIKTFLLILLTFTLFSFGQSKRNIDLIFDLVDQSISGINYEENFVLKFNSAQNLNVIKGRILKKLKNNNVEDKKNLNYFVDSLSVTYPEMFRDGMFGDYLLSRKVKLAGYYSLERNNFLTEKEDFNLVFQDTVLYSELNQIESQALNFTRGEIPQEPFFESVVETVIAVGAAVVSIILFFTIRSD